MWGAIPGRSSIIKGIKPKPKRTCSFFYVLRFVSLWPNRTDFRPIYIISTKLDTPGFTPYTPFAKWSLITPPLPLRHCQVLNFLTVPLFKPHLSVRIMARFIWRFKFIVVMSIWIIFIMACSPSNEKENKAPQNKPVPVKVIEIKARHLPLIIESVGRIAANKEVTLAAEVGGVVKGYRVDVGDRVKAGQVLVDINSLDYQLALNEALANLAAAQARLDVATKAYNRSNALMPQKAISADFFEKSEAEYKSALATLAQVRAFVDTAKERIRKTKITAPFAGFVAGRMVEKGQTVGAGIPVMTLVNLDSVRVKIHMTESDYVSVDKSDPVFINLEAFPEKKYRGKIDRIGIKADERTNTFQVEILVPNPDLSLKAGMTAKVRLTTGIIPDAIMVPQSTVLYRKDRKEVFVVGPDEKAEVRQVALGRTEGALVQILKGLAPGDRLVATGGQYLKSGDKLIISFTE